MGVWCVASPVGLTGCTDTARQCPRSQVLLVAGAGSSRLHTSLTRLSASW